MRKLFLFTLVLILTTFQSFAQGPMSYSKVIEVTGKSAKDIYTLSKNWFVITFASPKDVLQVDDPASNMISGKGAKEYKMKGLSYLAYEGWVNYIILIQARDGRFRIEITNIVHENIPGNAKSCQLGLIRDMDEQFTQGANRSFHNKVAEDIKAKMSLFADETFKNIESYITSNSTPANQEW